MLLQRQPGTALWKESEAMGNNKRSWYHSLAQLSLCLILMSWSSRFLVPSLLSSNLNNTRSLLTTVDNGSPRMKVLYIVTTLNEYDNGRRETVHGHDRLKSTLLPVVVEGTESMLRSGYSVDLVVICNYNMTRGNLIKDALPSGVGLEIWDDATPLGYKLEDHKSNSTNSITRALARQHRYVIKDKLPYYDHFVAFEDDMLITGESIRNYVEVAEELYRLRELATEGQPVHSIFGSVFYGNLTKLQLLRMIPGFIRVEVLLNEEKFGAQTKLDPVPITDRPQVDPNPCCQLHNSLVLDSNHPANPQSDKLVLWESNIKALGVRKMPFSSMLDWVVLQRGPRIYDTTLIIDDYWSGNDGYFKQEEKVEDRLRPDTKKFRYLSNQGGWMATRRQILEWHNEICPGGFLPPFDPPSFPLDGLDKRNVEYWSGGMSIFTRENACNLQRIIPLEHQRFARSLLYHSSNNKQKQFKKRQDILIKVNDFLGQLHTVRNNAQAAMDRRESTLAHASHEHDTAQEE